MIKWGSQARSLYSEYDECMDADGVLIGAHVDGFVSSTEPVVELFNTERYSGSGRCLVATAEVCCCHNGDVLSARVFGRGPSKHVRAARMNLKDVSWAGPVDSERRRRANENTALDPAHHEQSKVLTAADVAPQACSWPRSSRCGCSQTGALGH